MEPDMHYWIRGKVQDPNVWAWHPTKCHLIDDKYIAFALQWSVPFYKNSISQSKFNGGNNESGILEHSGWVF